MSTKPPIQIPPPPKVSLAAIDAKFIEDMANESLDGVARLYAGRIHQIIQNLRYQAALRAAKQRETDEALVTITGMLERLLAPEAGVQAKEEVTEAPIPQPPVPVVGGGDVVPVLDKATRLAEAQRIASERNGKALAKEGA